jgi:hypothetical protein
LCRDGLIDFNTGYSAATSPHEFKMRATQQEPAPVGV